MTRRFSAIVPRVRSTRFVSHAVRHKAQVLADSSASGEQSVYCGVLS